MRVAYLYNRSAEDPAHTAEDDVPARSRVVAALRRLGHKITPIACTLDLARVRRRLERAKPDVAFNRVESLGGSDAMAAAVPLLLDTMQIPYTGCSTESLVATASKLATKERLVRAGLPTPEWICEDYAHVRAGSSSTPAGAVDRPARRQSAIRNPKYILKSVYEHASFEMGDASVVAPASPERIVQLVREHSAKTGRPFFAERFVEGREFNLSLIGQQPHVLPPAEIDFSAFPAGKPRIVGHGAKWDGESFEFQNTPRRFDFPSADGPLIRRLTDLAVECWQLFGLCGYARVDFRCDAAGQPWILEINANPCISPASGFAAALERAGISFDDGIQRIIDVALPPGPPATKPRSRRPPLTVR